MRRLAIEGTGAILAVALAAGSAHAQAPDDPEITACKATALTALREHSPSVREVILDMDTLSVAKANAKVEDTPVRTVIMGDAYLERKGTGPSQRFLCLVGEKGKVLLTFFTTH